MDELTWKMGFIEELQALCVEHNKRIDFINFAEAATQEWYLPDIADYTPKQAAISYYNWSTK